MYLGISTSATNSPIGQPLRPVLGQEVSTSSEPETRHMLYDVMSVNAKHLDT